MAVWLPLYMMFETTTPGPSKTFCTKLDGLWPGVVTSWADAVNTDNKRDDMSVRFFKS
jgi:hypothetical protein